MKKLLLFIFVVATFITCRKADDAFPASKCKITELYIVTADTYETAYVSYTNWGAPLAITVTNERTGNDSYFFQYDTKQNLTVFIAGTTPIPGSNDTEYVVYKKFFWKNGRIDKDSFYSMGSTKNPNLLTSYGSGKYYYDGYGRIIKYVGRTNEDFNFTNTYPYPNENPYINNTNIVGTHPVLMFVNRDFNRKNQGVQTTNNFGMPTEFSTPYYFFSTGIQKVDYACTLQAHP